MNKKKIFHEIPGGTSRKIHGSFWTWNYVNYHSELFTRVIRLIQEFSKRKRSIIYLSQTLGKIKF